MESVRTRSTATDVSAIKALMVGTDVSVNSLMVGTDVSVKAL